MKENFEKRFKELELAWEQGFKIDENEIWQLTSDLFWAYQGKEKVHRIVIAKNVRFSWLPRRLTLKGNPPIYHWLWFNFG